MATSAVTTSIIISSGSEEKEKEGTVSDLDKLEMEVEDEIDLATSKITFTADYYRNYLPKGHVKIKKETLIKTNGKQQVFTYEETINDSVLKAASKTVENAIDEQRRWKPEEITGELIKEEPFCYHEESYVNRRVMSAWNTLNKKYRESVKESKKTGNGVLDSRGLLHNPQMEDWMSRVEGIQMLLDGLHSSVGTNMGGKRKQKKAVSTASPKQSRKNKKTRNLLQKSLYTKSVFYNSSPSDSDVTKSPVVKRKRRGITKSKDLDQNGESMSTVLKAVNQSNKIAARELALKENEIRSRVNLEASGSGMNHSSVNSSDSSVDRRISNLEVKMKQLHLKMDELVLRMSPPLSEMGRRLKQREKLITLKRTLIIAILALLGGPQPPLRNRIIAMNMCAGLVRVNRLLNQKCYRQPCSWREIYPDFRRLDLDSFPKAQYLDTLRFEKKFVRLHINFFLRHRGFGRNVKFYYNDNRPGDFYKYRIEELYLMMLYSLARPHRVMDIAAVFGRCPAEISVGLVYFKSLICEIAKSYLQDVDVNATWFDYGEARRSMRAMARKGIPLRDTSLCGDGTHRKCCNPDDAGDQNRCYNRYIRGVSLKFINCAVAQGITLRCYGPFEGRLHDSTCADQCDLYRKLEDALSFPAQNWVGLSYCDSAFLTRFPNVSAYNPANNRRQKRFNRKMSKVRICVEWSFCGPIQTFPGVDFIKKNKIGHQFARDYLIAVWLYNLKTIHYGNVTSRYFNCKPPKLEKYLQVPVNSLN